MPLHRMDLLHAEVATPHSIWSCEFVAIQPSLIRWEHRANFGQWSPGSLSPQSGTDFLELPRVAFRSRIAASGCRQLENIYPESNVLFLVHRCCVDFCSAHPYSKSDRGPKPSRRPQSPSARSPSQISNSFSISVAYARNTERIVRCQRRACTHEHCGTHVFCPTPTNRAGAKRVEHALTGISASANTSI